jgi:hypothetical protein
MGVVVMEHLDEKVAAHEATLGQTNEHLRTLEWMVGLSMAWNTLLAGTVVGVLLKFR